MSDKCSYRGAIESQQAMNKIFGGGKPDVKPQANPGDGPGNEPTPTRKGKAAKGKRRSVQA
jgi:hypothetical protein